MQPVRALMYDAFGGPLTVEALPDPVPPDDGVVVRVGATGICRSDWHGWQGHDPDVRLPHVPGHELAGTVEQVGPLVTAWRAGDRVTVPFVCACGRCEQCRAGDGQVCVDQQQPGFTHWGSFAERVALHHADVNLVRLPDELSFVDAASLGCRFATAYRAVVQQGGVRAGEQVVVHGCGGLGLAAVQVAVDAGARVVAVDVSLPALELARAFGADAVLDATGLDENALAAAVLDLTGGAHLSLDAVGLPSACVASVLSLRPRGRHVQVGLLPPSQGRPLVPMERVVGLELELLGSHGMAAASYPPLLALVAAGRLDPAALVTRTVGLDGAAQALRTVGDLPGTAVLVP